ncbi:hypothetical protein ACJX0J_026473, partial [Zea mays]
PHLNRHSLYKLYHVIFANNNTKAFLHELEDLVVVVHINCMVLRRAFISFLDFCEELTCLAVITTHDHIDGYDRRIQDKETILYTICELGSTIGAVEEVDINSLNSKEILDEFIKDDDFIPSPAQEKKKLSINIPDKLAFLSRLRRISGGAVDNNIIYNTALMLTMMQKICGCTAVNVLKIWRYALPSDFRGKLKI